VFIYKIKNLKFTWGFTLIEMLVTLGIITLLYTMILAYSRQSQSVSDLIREGNRIAFEIQKAKSSAMLTLHEDSTEAKKICGWGIYIDESPVSQESSKDSFIVFTDFCNLGSGSLIGNSIYDVGEEIETINLLKQVEIFETNISSVVFVPPEPSIKFYPILPETESGNIKIRLKNASSPYFEIKISPVGQIYKELKET